MMAHQGSAQTNLAVEPPPVEAVIAVAAAAADLVLAMQAAGLHHVKTKSNETDLVTEADVACEHFLRAELHALAPGVGFWGEESNSQPDQDAFWLVDPIDGTVNFAHGLPYCAINIAFCRGGEAVLGVTAQLPLRRIYWASRGEGAWLIEPDGSERPLQVSQANTLRSAFLATGLPYHSGEAADDNMAELTVIAARCLGLRILGAGALDIAQVAAGMLAGFWEGWLHPWDAAAGVLMVREAGGRVTDYSGQPWTFGGPGLVASNGKIHDQLLESIQGARAGLRERRLSV